ncbi:Meiosis-specific serine/threonine-protein kinase mek1 [Aspergillus hancockii]|nr:Meiosis-specific serine/threonine-protein kinase mek1 [Aspergillus hancockii]
MNGTSWNGYLMGKGSYLLSDGDVLKLSPSISLQYRSEKKTKEECFDKLQILEMEVFEGHYKVSSQKLGSGAFGQVYMAYKKGTGQQLACKIIDLRALKSRVIRKAEDLQSHEETRNKLLDTHGVNQSPPKKAQERLDPYTREVRILEDISHPNIITIEKVIKSSNTIYLFQELVAAGDLFSYLQSKRMRLDDIEAAVIMRQVLMALDYLHDRGIVHRDLKPDNILMTSIEDGGRVILTDFGCARKVPSSVARMSSLVGTFDYSAPEMHKYSYTKAIDMWSLGCVTAVLLTGSIPFESSLKADATELTQTNELKRLEAYMNWNKTGNRARDFVLKLLVVDEAKRMDVKQALRHDWFTNPAQKKDFEALYRRSIRDWKPRTHKGPLVIDLCSLIDQSKHSSEPMQSSCSDRYSRDTFEELHDREKLSNTSSASSVSPDYRSRCGKPASLSSTLSDPVLPPHRRIDNVGWSQSQVSGGVPPATDMSELA